MARGQKRNKKNSNWLRRLQKGKSGKKGRVTPVAVREAPRGLSPRGWADIISVNHDALEMRIPFPPHLSGGKEGDGYGDGDGEDEDDEPASFYAHLFRWMDKEEFDEYMTENFGFGFFWNEEYKVDDRHSKSFPKIEGEYVYIAQLDDLRTSTASELDKIAELETQLVAKNAELAELQHRYEQADSELRVRRGNDDYYRARIEALGESSGLVDRLRDENRGLRDENGRLRDEIEELRGWRRRA